MAYGRVYAEVQKCFDCGQEFHGWACWKMYLSWPEIFELHCSAIGILGTTRLREANPKKRSRVFKANLALLRRYWPRNETASSARKALV